MSASSQPGAATTAATLETIGDDVANALGSADSTAAQRVQNLGLVHQARVAQLTRTAASITARYGADSPQATAAHAKVTAAQATVARIAVVNRQTDTAAPQVAATGWALYGQQDPVVSARPPCRTANAGAAAINNPAQTRSRRDQRPTRVRGGPSRRSGNAHAGGGYRALTLAADADQPQMRSV